jgi:tRNA/rRNA methyltransferase
VAEARASGADDVLAAARVVGSLQEALSGTLFAAALTARRRELSLPVADARSAAGQAVAWTGQGEVAVVFGNETSGLSNEELALCHLPVTIPANPAFSSLNLAAAVQILCYELRLAAGGALPTPAGEAVAASFDEVERLHAHLERVMVKVDFLDPANPRRLLPRLRRLFGRARLEREEVAILRGFLTAVDKMSGKN